MMRTILLLTLALLTASTAALAQRGEGGRGGGGGGGRDGGGGDRGSSARSFSGGGGERGGSFRSFSGSRDGGARSFSRGSSRSFSEGRGGESIQRSFNQPSRGEFRGRSFEGSRSARSFDEGGQIRSYRGGERQTFGRDAFRTGQPGQRSIDGARRQDFDQARRPDFDRGGREFQARRPSEEQVRDFLQMRRDGQERTGRTGTEFRRDFRDARERDREFVERDRDFRDRDDFRDRIVRDRDFRDRDDGRFDRDYDRWRNGVWLGERGEGRDQRDWSGRWRDGDRFRISNRIRDTWWRDRDWDDDDFPFHGSWWRRRDWHDHDWSWWGDFAVRHHHPWYWWRWAAAPRLASWVTFGWPTYYYWDYGPGEYIYYDNGAIYVNGRWYQPAPVFYERTVELVERAPDLTAEEAAQMEWLPLGVFAVTREGTAEPDVLVQLAVTQEGVIGGTAFDQRTSASYPIEGIVEKQTQRAVWEYVDTRNRRVIMETSIFNLTQPEATGLVHYGPENIRVIQLVRLEEPPGAGSATTTTEGELPAPVR
jgi:hypothetical protein